MWEETEVVKWVKENRWVVFFAILGVVLIGWGGVEYLRPSPVKVEVVSDKEVESVDKVREIVVDVEGAVEKPGVYRLAGDARVADALTKAGGLAEKADRVWVARYVNLAQKLVDGAKIYIPWQGDKSLGGIGGEEMGVVGESGGVVSVNRASAEELDSLWGIGQARAKKIIDNRPYSSLDEVVTKAGIPKEILEKNKGKIGL